MTAWNRYDEYGRPAAGNYGLFGYTGQLSLGYSGLPELYDYKARNYFPRLGIFGQTDPIGYWDSANLYPYVLNDPVNLRDPLGLSCAGATVCACRVPGHIRIGDYCFAPELFAPPTRPALATSGVIGGGRRTTGPGDPKPQPKLAQNKPICGRPLNEPGLIIYHGTTGSLTAVIGGSYTRGSFTNILTGTSGKFYSYSFNVGADIGGASISGQFQDLASFNGGNDNTFSGAGEPITSGSMTSRDLNGNVVGNSFFVGAGPVPFTFGSSFSVTELTDIKQPGC